MCRHTEISWPMKLSGAVSETVSCLACGRRLRYSTDSMRILRRAVYPRLRVHLRRLVREEATA